MIMRQAVHVRELLARVEAVLRRSPARPVAASELTFAGGAVDLTAAEIAFKDGGKASLSEREVELLRYLAGQSGRPVSREEILSRVWGLDPVGITTRTIDMHIARLRQKLRDPDNEKSPEAIVTVRAVGYMAGPELRPLGREPSS